MHAILRIVWAFIISLEPCVLVICSIILIIVCLSQMSRGRKMLMLALEKEIIIDDGNSIQTKEITALSSSAQVIADVRSDLEDKTSNNNTTLFENYVVTLDDGSIWSPIIVEHDKLLSTIDSETIHNIKSIVLPPDSKQTTSDNIDSTTLHQQEIGEKSTNHSQEPEIMILPPAVESSISSVILMDMDKWPTNEGVEALLQETLSSTTNNIVKDNNTIINNNHIIMDADLPPVIKPSISANVAIDELSTCTQISTNDVDLDPEVEHNILMCSDNATKDPNFSITDLETSSSEDETHSEPASPEELDKTTKKRNRKAVPSEWKENIAKKLRNTGKQYISKFTNKKVAARCLKPPCENCIFTCSEKFSNEDRQRLFDQFWKLGNIDKQREFIVRQTFEVKRNQGCNSSTQRSLNYAYTFLKNNDKIRVCKRFFIQTLDINNKVIATARKKLTPEGFLKDDLRGKHHDNRKMIDNAIKEGINRHINSIPRIESHYLRAQSTREYIDGGRSITQIFKDYVEECNQNGKPHGNVTLFSKIFHNNFNISFFVPKKDLCEVCAQFENATTEEREALLENYNRHQHEKEACRKEKDSDKLKSDAQVIVSVFDLEAVLPAPNGEISLFYYKSKLATYNLTIFNLKTKEGICNIWHEGDANRGAIEITTCIFNFIKETAASKAHEDIEFIFYSDNCAGQQKNKYLLAMYMFAIFKFKNVKSITHKFMIKGHTQNEGDCMHSVIEKQIKRAKKSGPIYIPAQYVQLIRDSKKTPPFYKIKEFSFADFLNFKNLSELLGKNYNRNTLNENFNFMDIKTLQINRDIPYIFKYKTSYYLDEAYKEVNIYQSSSRASRRSCTVDSDFMNRFIRDIESWKQTGAYTEPTGISENKKRDLMSLVNGGYIPKTYFNFYNSLSVKKI